MASATLCNQIVHVIEFRRAKLSAERIQDLDWLLMHDAW